MNDQQQSRADARTYTTQPGESVAGIALRQCGSEDEWRNIIALNPEFSEHTACDYFPVGTVLTLPPLPVSQPAAAPIAYDGLTEEFTDEVARLAGDAPGIREAVWAALENCNAIIAPQGNAAPSPVDERVVAYELYSKATGHAIVDYSRRTYVGHLTEEAGYEARPLVYARAASANETGAEGAKPVATVRVTNKGYAMHLSTYVAYALPEGKHDLYARAPAQAAEGVRAWETDDGRVISDAQKQQALRDGGASASSVRPYVHALCRTAPAQADARVGLTYQQVEALAAKHQFDMTSFDYVDSNSLVDLVNDALRSIGQAEPRAEVTDWNTPCTGCATPRACQYDGCRKEPRAEVTGDTVLVPKRVVELLRIINRDGIIKRASELQEVYRLVDASRAQGGES